MTRLAQAVAQFLAELFAPAHVPVPVRVRAYPYYRQRNGAARPPSI